MRASDSIKELAGALAKAQATMAGAKKDATNPHFRSKYADLASCWEAAKSALPANGLCVIQTTTQSEKDEVVVITRLAHASGEWIEGELALPVSKGDAQGYGSALTYARRYGLCAITGIAPEDDDGNAAASARPDEKRPNTATQVAVDAFDLLPADEKKFLRGLAEEIDVRFDAGEELNLWLEAKHLENEEKLALWSLLPSKVRAAIKQQRQVASVKQGMEKAAA